MRQERKGFVSFRINICEEQIMLRTLPMKQHFAEAVRAAQSGGENLLRIQGMLERICGFDVLYQAYQEARRGKRSRAEVAMFSENLECELFKLQQELRSGTYEIGHYREFYVTVPKRRLVMSISFRDRIVQWAIYLVLNPYLERRFIFDSYACRCGKGTLAALDRLQGWEAHLSKRPDSENWYYLKLDISKYFYRIDHQILIQMLDSIVDDPAMMDLFRKIIMSKSVPFGLPEGMELSDCPPDRRLFDVGMPIGNLSSQMFANMYLDHLDQYCKHTLRIKYYIRYMDDIVILDNSLVRIHEHERCIRAFLRERLNLRLNNKTAIRPMRHGVEFVGSMVYPTHRKPRKKTVKRIKNSLRHIERAYGRGEITLERAQASIQSYFGLLQHTSSLRIREWIAENIVLVRKGPKHDE